MFERIKAYKNIKKYDEFLKGCKTIAEITGDDKLLKETNEALYYNEKLKSIIWINRKTARKFNLEIIKNGL